MSAPVVYFLIYAYCETAGKCKALIHSAHPTLEKCNSIPEKQIQSWRDKNRLPREVYQRGAACVVVPKYVGDLLK